MRRGRQPRWSRGCRKSRLTAIAIKYPSCAESPSLEFSCFETNTFPVSRERFARATYRFSCQDRATKTEKPPRDLPWRLIGARNSRVEPPNRNPPRARRYCYCRGDGYNPALSNTLWILGLLEQTTSVASRTCGFLRTDSWHALLETLEAGISFQTFSFFSIPACRTAPRTSKTAKPPGFPTGRLRRDRCPEETAQPVPPRTRVFSQIQTLAVSNELAAGVPESRNGRWVILQTLLSRTPLFVNCFLGDRDPRETTRSKSYTPSMLAWKKRPFEDDAINARNVFSGTPKYRYTSPLRNSISSVRRAAL